MGGIGQVFEQKTGARRVRNKQSETTSNERECHNMLHTNAYVSAFIYLSIGTSLEMSEAQTYSTPNRILADNNSLKERFRV